MAIRSDCPAGNQSHEEYLLRLTELELAARSANALAARIRQAEFPVLKELDSYDFSALPSLNKAKILEMARCEWIRQRSNCCLVGSVGTGKTHIAISLGLAACRDLLRVRYFTAAALVNLLEEKQKQYQLDKLLGQLDRLDLLICDELGHRCLECHWATTFDYLESRLVPTTYTSVSGGGTGIAQALGRPVAFRHRRHRRHTKQCHPGRGRDHRHRQRDERNTRR